MKESNSESTSVWQKTPVSNLVRYVPSGILFARMKVKGKLIRRSLKTKSITDAARRRLSAYSRVALGSVIATYVKLSEDFSDDLNPRAFDNLFATH